MGLNLSIRSLASFFMDNLYQSPANICRQATEGGHGGPRIALVCYLPIDTSLIYEIQDGLRDIAEKHHLKNEFGFITPIDSGKRCVWEDKSNNKWVFTYHE